MYKYCSTEESAARQAQLEQCLLALMQTLPYSRITIVDICQKANISRKSFYRYFGSKEDCLNAVLDRAITQCAAHSLPEQGESPYSIEVLQRFFRYWKDRAFLLDALQRSELSANLVSRMILYLTRAEHSPIPYPVRDPNYRYGQILFTVSGIMGLVFGWHRSGFQQSVTEMAATLHAILHR